MDIVPTQVFEDYDCMPTQEISQSVPQNNVQIGMLTVGSNTYPIKQGINCIGRHPDSDIVINDLTVSKKHAEIETNSYETTAWVCDLNSSNKTKLNNSILRPNRCYELKNGNVLEFGLVRAVYKTCRSVDESFIVETPTQNHRKMKQLIIPGTPDSSNNSSSLGENISVIPATQTDEKESVFRCPTLPRRTSTSSARKSSIKTSSIDISMDDPQSSDGEKIENVGASRIGIHEMETQKLFESNSETSSDIHDVETQKISSDNIKDLSKSSNKQKSNVHDVEKQCITDAEGDITDIHDVDTQPNSDIHDMVTMKKNSVQNITTSSNSTRDNKTFETEINEEGNNNVNNRVMREIETNESISDSNDATKRKSRSEYVQSIEKRLQKDSQDCSQLSFTADYENDLDTSRNLLGSQNLLEDYINNDELSDDDKSKSLASVKVSSNDDNDVNSKSDNESIFDAATQINSPKIGENAFKNEKQRVKHMFKSPVVTDDSDETDNECIFQRYSYKNEKENEQFSKSQVVDSDDSTTDEEGQFMLIAIKEKANCSFKKEFNESKETKNDTVSSEDSENLFDTLTQPVNRKNKDSLSKQDNENEVDSDAPTQVISKEIPENYIKDKDLDTTETDDMAPTQVLLMTESPLKGTRPSITSTKNKTISDNEDITEIEDDIPTQIINITTRKKVSSTNNDEGLNPLNPVALGTVDDCSVDNLDYETAPTQPINDIENKKSILSATNKSTNVSSRSKALNTVNLDDTLERNLNAIFEDVNEERIEEHPQISTQILENMLQSSQCEDKLSNSNVCSDTLTNNKANKSIKGRKSKTLKIDSSVTNKISRKSSIKNINNSQNTENLTTSSTQKRNVSIDSRSPAVPTVNASNENIEKEKTTLGTLNNSNVSVTLSRCILDDPSTPKSVPKNSSTPKSISKNLSTSKSLPAGSSTPKSIPIFDENISTPKSVSKSPSTPKLSRKKKHDKSKTAEVEEETQLLDKDENELNECSRNIDNQASNTSVNEQLQQPTTVPENDDEDILAGLPEVRISGTLSNPASPTSSISSEYRININHNRRRQISVRIAPKKRAASRKSSRKTIGRKNVENTEYPTANETNSTITSPNFTNSLENNFDVDKESVNANNKKNKKSKQSVKKVTTKNERKKSDTLPQSKSIAPIGLQAKRQSPLILNYRRTRNSSKENIDRSSVFQVGKEVLIENEVTESAKGIDLSISRIGKRSLSVTDPTENNPKKRKEDINEDATVDTNNGKKNTAANRRHSTNILNFITKRNSPINMNGSSIKKLSSDQEAGLDKQAVIKVVRMPVCTPTGSISSSTSTELMIENSNSNKTRQSQRKTSIDSQVVTDTSNNKNKKTTQTVGTRRNANRKKINKFESHADDISSQIGEESQEIEMIMNGMLNEESIDTNTETKKKVGKNTKTTKTKNTKGRRNANIYTDVDNTESSSTSSIVYESDNAHFEMPIIKLKQAKISKYTSNKANTTVNESVKETKRNTKQSSRLTRSRQQSVTESSVEEDTETANETVNETVSGTTASKTNNSRNKRQRQKAGKGGNNKKQKLDVTEKTIISDSNSSIETASILSTPNRTRRSMTSSFTSSPSKVKHKILFTGISNNNYNKLLTKLGASQVEDPTKCTVLVTDKVRRTVKFLCALSLSVPIVSVDWLVDSERSGHFVDLEGYILKDPAAEAKFRFKLAKSLEKAKEHKLLEGYTLVLTPNVAPPPLPELKSIIMSCGGKALVRPPLSWPKKAIIISREEDLGNANKFYAKAPRTVTIQSTEFILTGILRQELEFKEFKLT